MTLEYLTFYQGNLETGFDYIYAKKIADHAFYINAPSVLDLDIMDITDEKFDFSQKNRLQITIDKNLRPFADVWQNITFQWSSVERQLEALIADWHDDYAKKQPGIVQEWGLTIKRADEEQRTIVGYNDFPDNFDQLVKWLNSYAQGKLR
jgi:hypothetical protein